MPQAIRFLKYDLSKPHDIIQMALELTKKTLHDGINTLGPKELWPLSQENKEDFYLIAHTLYTQGQYMQALTAFTYLVLLNPLESRFALGSGACHQQLKDYKNAIAYYLLAMVDDSQDPIPAYYAVKCAIILESWGMALEFCNHVLKRATEEKDLAIREEILQIQTGLLAMAHP